MCAAMQHELAPEIPLSLAPVKIQKPFCDGGDSRSGWRSKDAANVYVAVKERATISVAEGHSGRGWKCDAGCCVSAVR